MASARGDSENQYRRQQQNSIIVGKIAEIKDTNMSKQSSMRVKDEKIKKSVYEILDGNFDFADNKS